MQGRHELKAKTSQENRTGVRGGSGHAGTHPGATGAIIGGNMKHGEREPMAKILKQQLQIHLTDLRDLCQELIESEDPYNTYNSVHRLKSMIGQIASDSWRYRDAVGPFGP